jgi:manganese oxidase
MTPQKKFLPARVAFLWMLLIVSAESASAQLTRARANDHRTTAGRMVDGELRVSLEAVKAEWRPRGEDGPVLTAALFAEEGGVPMAPGPMIRVAAGTPVRVTIRNTLDRPMTFGGLGDRGGSPAPGAPASDPAFLRATFMRLEPGESREVRFVPTDAVTSLYRARVLGPRLGRPEPLAFNGAFIVDPAGEPAPPDERILMISAAVLDERPSVKTFINGMSWPFTERLTFTVGDTVRWRVINGGAVAHPMHLHGFYFNVDARGDGGTETVYPEADRPLVVTDLMPGFSTMRMTWVAAEQGNWLFHCHLIRHMGEVQLFDKDHAARAATGQHPEHDMAGLVMGITVRPRPGAVTAELEPARRMDVWTSTRPGVFPEGPAHGFVLQDGATAPGTDAADGIGSTLVLRQGEPTRIVVHNRLPFALSMHWHGLELRSDYDGVGHWSGSPESPRAPIAPGDSRAVLITPPRAGTFMYHTHGEPGHELSQGLYGGFLVLGPTETLDPVRDRLFMLGSRGAVLDAAPAINGQ